MEERGFLKTLFILLALALAALHMADFVSTLTNVTIYKVVDEANPVVKPFVNSPRLFTIYFAVALPLAYLPVIYALHKWGWRGAVATLSLLILIKSLFMLYMFLPPAAALLTSTCTVKTSTIYPWVDPDLDKTYYDAILIIYPATQDFDVTVVKRGDQLTLYTQLQDVNAPPTYIHLVVKSFYVVPLYSMSFISTGAAGIDIPDSLWLKNPMLNITVKFCPLG